MTPTFYKNIFQGLKQLSLEENLFTLCSQYLLQSDDRQLLTNSLLQRGQIFITQSNGQTDKNVVQTRLFRLEKLYVIVFLG